MFKVPFFILYFFIGDQYEQKTLENMVSSTSHRDFYLSFELNNF